MYSSTAVAKNSLLEISLSFARHSASVIILGSILNVAFVFAKLISLHSTVMLSQCFFLFDYLCEDFFINLSALDELIKARFVEMFGDPVANDNRWKTIPLKDACKSIVDCPHSTPSYTSKDTGYMCIRTSIVKKNKILWDEIEYIPEEEYVNRIQRKKPEKGDIVYTREGAILGIAAIIDRDYNVSFSTYKCW